MAIDRAKFEEVPTGRLIQEALDGVKEVVRLEVALAKDEVQVEGKAAVKAGIALGAAALGLSVGVAMLAVGFVLAMGASPWAAFRSRCSTIPSSGRRSRAAMASLTSP